MKLLIKKITTKKNLLAFSGGVDSSALFFTLLDYKIPFDIVIINYNIRKQSKQEVEYAQALAKKYNKKIFLKEINIESTSNFEKKARDIRYKFFKEIIELNQYEALITAHQLNDKLEWFFMQLSRGAGLLELISFEEYTSCNNYEIVRPLINTSRKEILSYLKSNSIKYYIDKSNFDEKYRRNYFRKNYANDFLDEFEAGIKKSFEYLQNDIKSLNLNQEAFFKEKELEIFLKKEDENLNIRTIDLSLKKRGVLLSKNQRNEILRQKEIVVSHKISISITDKYIFICPYSNENMPKDFKEKCRVKKIPKNIRAYIFNENIENILTKI